MSYDIESNIRAPVLLNLLNSLQKEIKCSASLAFYLFSPTRLINSVKHEHSCKVLYVINNVMATRYKTLSAGTSNGMTTPVTTIRIFMETNKL